MRNFVGRNVILVAVVAVAVAGCGGEAGDGAGKPRPEKAAAKAADAPKVAAKPKAVAPAEATAPSDTTEGVVVRRFRPRRDPFQSIIESRGRIDVEQTHPLQQFTIPQLQLKGIIWGIAQPVGLVLTPNNEEYTVRTGTPIGTGDGKVVAILPDRVVILERYYDYRGQLQTEKYEMILPSEGE